MIWVYQKLKNATAVLGSYSKKNALKLFKDKKDYVLLDLRTRKDLNEK